MTWKFALMSAWALLAAGAASERAFAQAPGASGWSIVARIVPNPMTNGRCGGITVEVHDQDGYRVGPLSNGEPADPRRFTYTNSNPAAFSWKDDDPTQALVCAKADAPDLSKTTIGVTTPDGLHDQVELTSAAPGKSRPAVIYAKQHPLRLPGSPPKYVDPAEATRVAATAAPMTVATVATMAPSAAAAAPAAPPSGKNTSKGENAAPAKPKTATLTTAPMSVVFPYHSVPPIVVTSPVMAVNGVYIVPPPVVITSAPMVVVGAYSKRDLPANPTPVTRESSTKGKTP